VSLVDAIRSGRRTFREAGLDRAYCGDPAAASTEEGHATFDVLAQIVSEQVLEALER
jgi:creatinine amidohydrolase